MLIIHRSTQGDPECYRASGREGTGVATTTPSTTVPRIKTYLGLGSVVSSVNAVPPSGMGRYRPAKQSLFENRRQRLPKRRFYEVGTDTEDLG